MAKKKTPSPAVDIGTEVVVPKRTDVYRAYTVGDDVTVLCLDGGDVEVVQDGTPVTLDDGIILRWGRRRG